MTINARDDEIPADGGDPFGGDMPTPRAAPRGAGGGQRVSESL